MKKVFFLLVFSMFYFSSCIVELEDYFFSYTLVNQSSHAIRINAYGEKGVLKEVKYIAVNDSLYTIHDEDGDFSPAPPFGRYDIDSVAIIFDEEYVLSQVCVAYENFRGCSTQRNVIGLIAGTYNKKKIGENAFAYRFAITDEDYANAVKID